MYTDNLLINSSASYPTPRSWFARSPQAHSQQNSDREDMRLIEQMICNEVLEPVRGGRQLAKGLRTIRENGSLWLSLFANDLLLVMPMARISTLTDEVAVNTNSRSCAPANSNATMEEVVIDEWPVATPSNDEDVYFRTVDTLKPGAILEIRRDTKQTQHWRLLSRNAASGELTLETVGGQKRLTRTRSGLAAELRRGACHVLPTIADPKPMWARVLAWLHSS
ncbi:MAG: hypothetical protein U1F34_04500 [Gammaproteobacteria bacterium]